MKIIFCSHPLRHKLPDSMYENEYVEPSDHNNLWRVLNSFLQHQGTELNEGIVFREFLKLSFLAHHAKSNMPLTKEFRLFFFNGQLLQPMYYWDEGDYSETWPNITPFLDIARKVQSFFLPWISHRLRMVSGK